MVARNRSDIHSIHIVIHRNFCVRIVVGVAARRSSASATPQKRYSSASGGLSICTNAPLVLLGAFTAR